MLRDMAHEAEIDGDDLVAWWKRAGENCGRLPPLPVFQS